MSKPIVALVGRPNVGKSALFNRIVGKRISIVADTPGVTRDRIYGEAEWRSNPFSIIDTGGIVTDDDNMLKQVIMQAELAIDEADVIVFVVDGLSGVTPSDEQVASILRKSRKPVLVAVNKSEGDYAHGGLEFYELGFDRVFPVSALHGTNTGDFLDEVTRLLPDHQDDIPVNEQCVKVSVIGRPNVGKSSLVNAILEEERVIVSDIPGTTRDAIDSYLEKDGKRYLLIDTAGLRKKSKIYHHLEKYSVIRSIKGLERSDVSLLLIDPQDGITDQDKKIAALSQDQGKALIILVNKWDALQKDEKTADNFIETVRDEMPFVNYAPILFISALTGRGVHKIFPVIDDVAREHSKRISTSDLNKVVEQAVAYTPPPTKKGKQLKIFYATQIRTKPPTFVLFVNDTELMKTSYKRYFQNQFRRFYGFEGTPIRILERVRKRG